MAEDTTPAPAIASLPDPAKLATLKGERAANPRLYKCLYGLPCRDLLIDRGDPCEPRLQLPEVTHRRRAGKAGGPAFTSII